MTDDGELEYWRQRALEAEQKLAELQAGAEPDDQIYGD